MHVVPLGVRRRRHDAVPAHLVRRRYGRRRCARDKAPTCELPALKQWPASEQARCPYSVVVGGPKTAGHCREIARRPTIGSARYGSPHRSARLGANGSEGSVEAAIHSPIGRHVPVLVTRGTAGATIAMTVVRAGGMLAGPEAPACFAQSPAIHASGLQSCTGAETGARRGAAAMILGWLIPASFGARWVAAHLHRRCPYVVCWPGAFCYVELRRNTSSRSRAARLLAMKAARWPSTRQRDRGDVRLASRADDRSETVSGPTARASRVP